MDIRILENPEQIAAAAGGIFAAAVKSSPKSVFGLATGATPVPMYKHLISLYNKGEISFKEARTFNLDEYCGLPQSDPNSYYSFMFENLFNSVDIPPANVHILDGNAGDIDAECANFDKLIADIGGIDIQLLGIGTNGHIGFNEPAEKFTEGTFKVKLSDSTIKSNMIYFPDGNMPHYALTMGIGSIMKAQKIVLIATGASKAEAVKVLIKGKVTPQCPASVLQKHPDAVIFLDKEAAGLL